MFRMRAVSISGSGFLWAGSPPHHPTNSVKVMKGTMKQSDPCKWPGLILS